MAKAEAPSAAVIEAEAKAMTARGKAVGGVVSGVGGAVTGVAKGASDAISSYFEAEAVKEVARQRTQQAALKENAPILHELDVPFITVKMDLGTKRRPIPMSVNLTLLNMFGIGDTFERIYGDLRALKAGVIPRNFSSEWDDIRTPRTQQAGTRTNPPVADTVAAVAMTDKERDRWNAAMGSNATISLARGDFAAAIGFWLAKK